MPYPIHAAHTHTNAMKHVHLWEHLWPVMNQINSCRLPYPTSHTHTHTWEPCIPGKSYSGVESASNFGEYFKPLCYSTKLHRFVYFLWKNLLKITSKYLLWPRVKYLYFGQILWLFSESEQISFNYLCFWPFVGQSQIIIQLWCNADLYTRITRIIIRVITQKWPKFDF